MKTTVKQTVVPKSGTFMGIKDVQLDRVSLEFSQDSDTNQCGDSGQYLRAYTENGGGDCYIVIETERWAMDSDDIDKFCETLKHICKTPEERG